MGIVKSHPQLTGHASVALLATTHVGAPATFLKRELTTSIGFDTYVALSKTGTACPTIGVNYPPLPTSM